jgi:hypothetical protein
MVLSVLVTVKMAAKSFVLQQSIAAPILNFGVRV